MAPPPSASPFTATPSRGRSPLQQRQQGSKNMTARLSLIAALLLSTATAAGAAELRIGLENDPDTLDPDRSRLFVYDVAPAE